MAHGDEELLASAREGDRAALEELLERHRHRVLRLGMKMCGEEEDAKDVLQETLLAAARGIRDFRGASSLSTWLYAIARSFCLKRHLASQCAPADASIDTTAPEARAVPDPRRGPEEAAMGAQLRAALERAIAGLEPMYREVLVLRDLEGLSALEVADVLGVSVAAVKSRLHRARLAVRQQLAPVFGSAAAFLLVDTDTRAHRVFENTNAHHACGHCAPAALLGREPIDAFIVGGIGAGALSALLATGAAVYRGSPGPASEAVAALVDGRLRQVGAADVCGEHHHR